MPISHSFGLPRLTGPGTQGPGQLLKKYTHEAAAPRDGAREVLRKERWRGQRVRKAFPPQRGSRTGGPFPPSDPLSSPSRSGLIGLDGCLLREGSAGSELQAPTPPSEDTDRSLGREMLTKRLVRPAPRGTGQKPGAQRAAALPLWSSHSGR